jgi:hypothetical protein
MIKTVCFAACIAATSFVAIADEPAAPATPPADANMMGHSPADAKSMRTMTPGAPAGDAAEAPSAPNSGMSHSPADAKAMRMMSSPQAKSTAGASDSGEHNMMSHSPADAKSMRHMKHKHPKMHKTEPKPTP